MPLPSGISCGSAWSRWRRPWASPCSTGQGVDRLKKKIINSAPLEYRQERLILGDLIREGDRVAEGETEPEPPDEQERRAGESRQQDRREDQGTQHAVALSVDRGRIGVRDLAHSSARSRSPSHTHRLRARSR